jgi:hypothetical protein
MSMLREDGFPEEKQHEVYNHLCKQWLSQSNYQESWAVVRVWKVAHGSTTKDSWGLLFLGME